MAQQIINIGAIANDGTGDDLRTAGNKINQNFTEAKSARIFKPLRTYTITIDK